MDKLVINDIVITTLIGIHSWEQRCPQRLHLDIALQTDAAHIAEHDSIEHAIDYDRLIAHIIAFSEQNHFQLLETFTERLAQEILQHFSTQWVKITLHKPGALAQASDVSLTIERTR